MNKRLSKEKQALVLAALSEGTPINAVPRMFRVGKHAVLRVIRETGEAFMDYMDQNLRDLRHQRRPILYTYTRIHLSGPGKTILRAS